MGHFTICNHCNQQYSLDIQFPIWSEYAPIWIYEYHSNCTHSTLKLKPNPYSRQATIFHGLLGDTALPAIFSHHLRLSRRCRCWRRFSSCTLFRLLTSLSHSAKAATALYYYYCTSIQSVSISVFFHTGTAFVLVAAWIADLYFFVQMNFTQQPTSTSSHPQHPSSKYYSASACENKRKEKHNAPD